MRVGFKRFVKIHDWMMGQISSDLTLFLLRVVLKPRIHKKKISYKSKKDCKISISTCSLVHQK